MTAPDDELSPLEKLVEDWRKWSRKIEGRYYRLARGLLATVGLLAVAVLLGFLAVNRLFDQQEASRYRAVYSACLERDKTNAGIQAYLKALGTRGRVLDEAEKAFPVRKDVERSCRKYTLALLGDDPPRTAFALPERVKRLASPTASPSR